MKRNLYHTAIWRASHTLIIVLLLMVSLISYKNANAFDLNAWTIRINPDNGYVGTTFSVKLKGFTPGFNAAIRWDGVDQVTFTMPASGQYATFLTVPAGAAPGAHTVSACNFCGGGDFEERASTTFTVRALPRVTLPFTPLPPTRTFTPIPPTHTPPPPPTRTFTPPPTNTPTPTLTVTSTVTSTPETESPSPTVEPTGTQDQPAGEEAFPGEIFIDQASLSVPSCAPNEAKFTAMIHDPAFNPMHISLVVLPASDASQLGVWMDEDERGVYSARLQLNEESPVGDWLYYVIALDETGLSYRSKTGTLSVNACGMGDLESSSSDQLIQLIPYAAVGLLACSGFGLLLVVVVVVVRWSRRR
jgi:hypothetical protein